MGLVVRKYLIKFLCRFLNFVNFLRKIREIYLHSVVFMLHVFKEIVHLRDLGADGTITLRWLLMK